MRWSEFAEATPELARLTEERFQKSGLMLMGTLRSDGWPRISPVEPLIFEGQLILGGTWGTRKTLDLLRDSRCVVNTIVCSKDGTEGEMKIVGRALPVTESGVLDRLRQDIFRKSGFRPGPKTYRHFWMDILSAAFIQYGQDLRNVVKLWVEGEPVRECHRRWTLSGYELTSHPPDNSILEE